MNKNIGDMTESELKDFIIELQEENSRYERKIERLEEVIDKAVGSIALIIRDIDENNFPPQRQDLDEILEILKGDSNE